MPEPKPPAKFVASNPIGGPLGSRDAVSERALAEALEKGGCPQVTRPHRDQEVPEECCWLRGSGRCLPKVNTLERGAAQPPFGRQMWSRAVRLGLSRTFPLRIPATDIRVPA